MVARPPRARKPRRSLSPRPLRGSGSLWCNDFTRARRSALAARSGARAVRQRGFAMRLRYGFSVLGLASILVLSPALSYAQSGPSDADAEEQARAHFRLARAYYDNGDFAQAGIEFEEAYRISQRAALLYNIYLAHRDANDTRKAA